MNETKRILLKIAKNSKGKMRLVKVPQERHPTVQSLARLKSEIDAQITRNDLIRYRSYINANKS